MNSKTVNERIRVLRKELGLTLTDFGDVIGVRKQTLSSAETGINSVSNQLFTSICNATWPNGKKVSEAWLRNGEGAMFLPDTDNELDALCQKYGLDSGMKVLIKKLIDLPQDAQANVLDFMVAVANELSGDHSPPLPIYPREMKLEDKVEAYRQALLEVAKAEEKLSTSSSPKSEETSASEA